MLLRVLLSFWLKLKRVRCTFILLEQATTSGGF